jgi:long-chain acyl-CoA synthetase
MACPMTVWARNWPGETLEAPALQEFLAERIAKFKVPWIVTVVTESLPRNASGKILKRDLRDEVAAR